MTGKIQVQDIKARLSLLHPLRRWTVIGDCRPHTLHLRGKAEGERHRPHRLDLVIRQGAGTLGRTLRSKEDLADGEIGMRESDGRVPRLNIDRSHLLIYVDGDGVILHLRGYAHMAQNFPGKNPGFEGPILLPQKGPTRAGYG